MTDTSEIKSNSNQPDGLQYSNPYLRSLKELVVLVIGAAAFMVWTLVYCGNFGYANEKTKELSNVMGMPSWVFWGILLPWLCAGLFSIWFALFFIKDDDKEFNRIVSQNIALDETTSQNAASKNSVSKNAASINEEQL